MNVRICTGTRATIRCYAPRVNVLDEFIELFSLPNPINLTWPWGWLSF
jgi:hypothetical protein